MRDYYQLMDDSRIAQKVKPQGLRKEDGFEQLPPISILDVAEHSFNEYTDWLEKPVPMMSQQMKSIIEKYNPRIQWKCVHLIDKRSGSQNVYWVMQIPTLDCLSQDSEFYLNGTVKRLVLDHEKVKAHHFFAIEGILEPYIVVSLDAAESLLRRSYTGFVLQKVEQVQRRE
ncbi:MULTISPECIES: imm11 family protein [unclassified Brevibacillus]|uniref:imm11 family protein n=1 Tax=unclassified Brevibacillus TaxID=2684853 RepID=UPI0035621882